MANHRGKQGNIGGGGKVPESKRPAPNPVHLVHPEIWALLTKRETEILTLYLHHPNDKEIAHKLGTSASTIRSHLSAIEKKAGVDSRAELLALFIPEEPEEGNESPSSK